MELLIRIKDVLVYPLVHLAGGSVTIASILIGAVIVLVARIVASGTGHAVARMLDHRGVHASARFAMVKIIRYLILLIGILIAVTSLGIKLDALLAASTVLLVGIGFGLQNIAQNFISGVIVLLERPVGKGDFIQVGSTFGTVVDIGMRSTKVVTRDEVTIIVPNSELVTAQVVNHSVPSTNLRIAVKVGVAYGSDTALVRELLMKLARADRDVLESPEPEVRFEDFGDSSLDFSLRAWIADPREDHIIASRLRFAIDAAFRSANIEIPFPQRDLHIRSGLDALAVRPSLGPKAKQ